MNTPLDQELRALIAQTDSAARAGNRRDEVAAPELLKLAQKYGVSESRVHARFWGLVGAIGLRTKPDER